MAVLFVVQKGQERIIKSLKQVVEWSYTEAKKQKKAS